LGTQCCEAQFSSVVRFSLIRPGEILRVRAAYTLLAFIVACGSDRPAVTPAHGDWPDVHATDAWTGATRWTVERDLSIGVVTGKSDYEFGHVVDVEAARDGRIYVLDQQAGEIRVFDRDGAHLTSFGRPGRGPGELSNNIPLGAQALFLTSADELVVLDPANDRATRFALDGKFLDSFSLGAAEGRPLGLSVLPSGDYVLHRSSQRWNGLLRLGRNGETLDTLVTFPLQALQPVHHERQIQALRHEGVWSVLRDGRLSWGTSDNPRLIIRDTEADSATFVDLTDGRANPILSRREQDRFLERLLYLWADMFRRRGESEAWIESELRKGSDIYVLPQQLPMFTGLASGPEETLWVRGVLPVDSMTHEIVTSGSALSALARHEWRVFARDGQFLGGIMLPPRFTFFKIRGTHIYGMERDDLGVQRVVRLQIRLD
jgi:hypothetical protein